MSITVEQLKNKIEKEESFFLLDVREQHEFDEFNINGHLIPLGELPHRIKELEDYKNKQFIVHCRSGVRSLAAQNFLKSEGFTDVYNLEGGVLAW